MGCRETSPSLTSVAVTGMGILSPFGEGMASLLSALDAGRTALQRNNRFPDGLSARVSSCSVGSALPGRARRLATVAAHQAMASANLPTHLSVDAGFVLGTIAGEVEGGLLSQRPGLSDHRKKILSAAWSWNRLASRIAARLGLKGAVVPVSTACASGADALGLAAQEIRMGRHTTMVAGGVETLTPFQWEGFRRLRALAPTAVRPFDTERNGTGLGEGACFWVLEAESQAVARGARILGRILGWATGADAFSLVAPDPLGQGLARAIGRAFDGSGVVANDVAFVVAHATGTLANDQSEALALRSIYPASDEMPPVTGIKGATGHCLGASAAVEASAALGFLAKGRVPSVVGLRQVDPALGLCPLSGVSKPLSRTAPAVALTLASGFGGQNAALVLGGGEG